MFDAQRSSRSTALGWLVATAGVGLAYFALGRLALLLAIPPGYATAVWPAAGVALAGTLLFGYRVWPGVFVGSFFVNVFTSFDSTSVATILGSAALPAAVAVGAVLQAFLGAYLVRRWVGFPGDLDRLGGIVRTMTLGGPLACLTNATIGVASLLVSGSIDGAAFARSWGIWWLGDSVGVLVVVPFLAAWVMDLHRAGSRTRLYVSLPILGALAITLMGYAGARNRELERAQADFQRLAESMVGTLEQSILSKLEILHSIVSLFETHGEFDRSDFRVFVGAAFERHPDLSGLSWNAVVPGDGRSAFEDQVRQEGFPGFSITEGNADDELVPAADRDEYVVVTYIEPPERNRRALGYDLASDPDRAGALAKARDTGQIRATAPITLVQEPDQKPGFLFFAPIYEKGLPRDSPDQRRRNLHSFVSGVFRAEAMIETALGAFRGGNVDYAIADTSDPEDPRTLCEFKTSSEETTGVAAELGWSSDLLIAGQRWTVRFRPLPHYTSAAHWGRVWVILTGGLFLTGLLGAVLVDFVGRTSSTERASELALKASEEQFRAVFENAAVGVAIVDHDDHPAVSNDALQRMLGYSGAELAAMRFAELTHPEEVDGRVGLLELASAGPPCYESERRYLTKRGETVWGHLSVSLVRDPDGAPLFAIAMVQDITERKLAERERIKLEAKVLETQKLESLGVLAGGIAHDFNNLLVAVLGNAELARETLAPAAPELGYLRAIETAAERAAGLANQLLAYSGRGRFVVEPIDLSDLVQEMVHLVQVSVSKNAVVEYDLARNLPSLECDTTQLRQVVINLITNASEAIGDGAGVVSVVTGQMECDADYLAGTLGGRELREGRYVFVEVSDTGCGMDGKTRERIFDPFFTTKFTGRGLGLAAVLGIVRSHEGALLVQSEPGRGTTIRVLLPCRGRPAPELPAPEADRAAWQGEGTVLLVDDEETVRQVGRSMIELLGFDVITAVDGREAVKIYRERSEDIVLVLLDLTMPRMGGAQTLAELRRIRDDVRIVLSSGYAEQDTGQLLEGGRAVFIQKPYRIDALRDRFREILVA